MKRLVISTLLVLQVLVGWAQTESKVTGLVVDSKTKQPLQGVVVSVENSALTTFTNELGQFTIEKAPTGNQIVSVVSAGFNRQLLNVKIEEGQTLDLGTIVLAEDQTEEQQLALITIVENDLGDDNSGSENTAGLLQATRDVYQQAAAFNWGQARFRIRGLDNEYGTTMINGVVMNKILDGRPQWGNWGGLNDATRNQEFTFGTAPSDYNFGGILGTQEINTRASIYRPGSRVSFAGTNTNYSYRIMGTHASGMNKDGWAYVVSAGRRWATQGYFEGTDYDANSLFASVEKKIGENHSLNFTAIYAQNKRGRNSANTQEVTDLAGVKYNSWWGYQEGERRNSRVREVEEPVFMLSHYWKINDKNKLTTNVMHQFGKIGNSRIDAAEQATGIDANGNSIGFLWEPTYYRNLPSYYTSLWNLDDYTDFQGDDPANVALADQARQTFLNNRQINWDAIYRANRNSVDGRSNYILYEDRTDDKLWVANSILSSQLSDNIAMNAGVSYRTLHSENFQNVLDLLGGTYFADYDFFFTGDAAQPDLNNPNRNVGVGDRYGYNYILRANTLDAFTQFRFNYRKIDFYLAQSFTATNYQREGLYRNGIYPNNSFGKSENVDFENFAFKGGFTWKLTGRNFINFNGAHLTKAPTMRNTFFNTRLNNNVVDNIQSENVSSMDLSYILRTPTFKLKLTGFLTRVRNATTNTFFFADAVLDEGGEDGAESAFVAQTMTGVARRNMGVEFGSEYQITSTLKATLAASYGEYIFDSNPNLFLNSDSTAAENADILTPVSSRGQALLKNYRQPGMPQQAYSFGLEYRDPKFWWIGANVNYLADTYIDIAPLLRTNDFVTNFQDPFNLPFPEATPERTRELLKQEKFDPYTLVNLTGGKSWRIKGNTFGFFASVNNVFDVTYKTGGFEQPRNSNFRLLNQDVLSGTPAFGNRYFYGFGRTYFINLYINF
ncbi:carboxypeptidase-like regulatory domain-containing protein [Flavobacterium sp.]|uniref:carboxypeptidase-like regulatory domain-containing protein n=1 Tax=Flavobacterium sp. TaxID=239 RepID=UPI002603BDE6|nr:carboxypeptidase-like regulatory domain-containing protein [Flavobacterium sp.]